MEPEEEGEKNQPQRKTKYDKLHENLDKKLKEKWEQQQKKINSMIIERDQFKWTVDKLTYIAGVDLSASKHNPDIACAGLVVYNLQEQKVVYQDNQIIQINQPYIPGFLAFREVPPLYHLFQKLKEKQADKWPELVLVDGNGILHPQQCGLACHLGVLIDTPTIGVGKTLFYIDGLDKDHVKKQCEKQIHKQGDSSILVGKSGRKWGAGLRMTADSKNPVFVSIGHRITLQTAITCVLKVSKFRVPEPIRLADKRTREIIEAHKEQDEGKLTKYEMVYL